MLKVDLVFHLAFMTTPLVAAASHGHVEVVKLLLAARRVMGTMFGYLQSFVKHSKHPSETICENGMNA